jgi:hypothetical protein
METADSLGRDAVVRLRMSGETAVWVKIVGDNQPSFFVQIDRCDFAMPWSEIVPPLLRMFMA